MAMSLVQTITVGSGGVGTLEFTNIPQNGKDLRLVLSGRGTFTYGSVSWIDIYVEFNTTGGNNFSRILLASNGTSASSGGGPNNNLFMPDSSTTSNTFSVSEMYIANYAGGTNKVFAADSSTENNATLASLFIIAGLKSETTAISSIKLIPAAGNFAQHSTLSLYIIS